MVQETTGSTVPRRQLGRYLRDMRNRQRMTVKTAAELLEWSETKVWRIETGQTSLRSHDVALICEVYAAPPDLKAALMGLARETKAKGWWHAYGDVIPEGFDVYIGLEEAASQLSSYQPELVPGLLQTPDYIRTLARANEPDEGDNDEIERRVTLRIARQELVRRPSAPPGLRVALNESVLRRPVGGPDVMAAQLDSLAESSGLPNIALRVVPYSAGLHRGLTTGPFVILRFPMNGNQESEPATVYVEGFTGALYLDKPREVDRYTGAFESIWRAALDETATKDLLYKSAEELRN